jgi:7-cyano-7-deazaguanine synthase
VRISGQTPGKAVVLLSGGLDSAAAAAIAPAAGYEPSAALFFDYGQRAARNEERAARGIAGRYALAFERIDLPWMARLSKSALVARGAEPPRWTAGMLDDASPRDVWVENRNGIFVNAAAFYAAERGMDAVVVGFNREEAAAFPDNSAEFVDRINRAFELSLAAAVRVVAPTLGMTKREIAARALAGDFPWELLWSCYRGGDAQCGRCESCLRLKRAVEGTPAQGRVHFEKEDA